MGGLSVSELGTSDRRDSSRMGAKRIHLPVLPLDVKVNSSMRAMLKKVSISFWYDRSVTDLHLLLGVFFGALRRRFPPVAAAAFTPSPLLRCASAS